MAEFTNYFSSTLKDLMRDADINIYMKHLSYNDRLRQIWSPKSEYREFTLYAMRRVDADDDELKNLKTTICHICSVNVPDIYMKDHCNSQKHTDIHKIIAEALKRVQSNFGTKTVAKSDAKDDKLHYCEACNIVIRSRDKDSHNDTVIHTKSLIEDKSINKFLRIFDRSNEPYIFDDDNEVSSAANSQNSNGENQPIIDSQNLNGTSLPISESKTCHGTDLPKESNVIKSTTTDVLKPVNTKSPKKSKVVQTPNRTEPPKISKSINSPILIGDILSTQSPITEAKSNDNAKDISTDVVNKSNESPNIKLLNDFANALRVKLLSHPFEMVPEDVSIVDENYVKITLKYIVIKVTWDNYNGFVKNNKDIYCQLCEINVTDTSKHMWSKEHMDCVIRTNIYCMRMIKPNNYHCIICNIWTYSIQAHVLDSKHEDILKNVVCHQLDEKNVKKSPENIDASPIIDNVPVKNLKGTHYVITSTADPKELICNICSHCTIPNMPWHITEHINGEMHKNKYTEYLTENKLSALPNGLVCFYCRFYVPFSVEIYHVCSVERKNVVGEISVDQIFCQVCYICIDLRTFEQHLNGWQHKVNETVCAYVSNINNVTKENKRDAIDALKNSEKTTEFIMNISSEINNIQLTTSAVKNVQQTASLVKNIPQTSSAVNNVHPDNSVVKNVLPTTSAANKVQPDTSLVKNVQKTTAIVKNVQPTTSAANKVQPDTSAVKNVQMTTAIVKNVQPTTAIVKNVQPTTSDANKVQPDTSLMKNVQETTAIVKNVQPTTSAANNVLPDISVVKNVESTTSASNNVQPYSLVVKNVQQTTTTVKNVQPAISALSNIQSTPSTMINIQSVISALNQAQQKTGAVNNFQLPTYSMLMLLHHLRETSDPYIALCKLCKVSFPNTISSIHSHLRGISHTIQHKHLVIKNKLSWDDLGTIYCTICDIYTKYKYELDHINGRLHKNALDLLTASNESVNSAGIEQYLYQFVMTANPREITCRICRVTLTNSIDTVKTHLDSNEHIEEYKDLFKYNKILLMDSYFYCCICDVKIKLQKEVDHILETDHFYKRRRAVDVADCNIDGTLDIDTAYFCGFCTAYVPESGYEKHLSTAEHMARVFDKTDGNLCLQDPDNNCEWLLKCKICDCYVANNYQCVVQHIQRKSHMKRCMLAICMNKYIDK